jgi:hypothetical protein
VDTKRVVPLHAPFDRLYPNTALPKVFDASPAILLVPNDFEDHSAFLTRQDEGLQDIESKAVVRSELADDRLFPGGFGESKNFGRTCHGEPPSMVSG